MSQSTNQATNWLTEGTRAKLAGELEELKTTGRRDIVARISAARDEGDLKENGGYHAAKEEQGKIEARINHLEALLEDCTTEHSADDAIVSPGKVVHYRFPGDEQPEVFLLGARENEHPSLEVFSPQSALGAALLGHGKGEMVEFTAPNGKKLEVEIVDVEPYTGG